jgi:hypothetical protein
LPLDEQTSFLVAQDSGELADKVRNLKPQQVMDYFAANAIAEPNRLIAKRLGDMMKYLQKQGYKFTWGVYGPKNMGATKDIKRFVKDSLMGSYGVVETSGVPYPKKGIPKTSPSGYGKSHIGVQDIDSAMPGVSERTIIHEYVHAVTAGAIWQYMYGRIPQNSRVGQAVQELMDLTDDVIAFKNKALADAKAGAPVDQKLLDSISRLSKFNSFQNAHELIAQALSNWDMQNLLKSMPYKKTNGFVEFIKYIGKLLGVSKKDENALRRLLEISDTLIPKSAADRAEVAMAAMKPTVYSQVAMPPNAPAAVPTAPGKEMGAAPEPERLVTPTTEDELLLENEVPSVPATELVVPEEAASAITSDAATAPEKDTKKMIAEAAKPMIRLYDMRSEMQEQNRGCG